MRQSSNNVYPYPGGQVNYKHLQCLCTPNWFIIYQFYSALLSNISTVSPDDYLLVCGDFNGHVGKALKGFNGVHDRYRLYMIDDTDSEADVESIRTEIKSFLVNSCGSVYSWIKGNSK